jgi:hypothetical protein
MSTNVTLLENIMEVVHSYACMYNIEIYKKSIWGVIKEMPLRIQYQVIGDLFYSDERRKYLYYRFDYNSDGKNVRPRPQNA